MSLTGTSTQSRMECGGQRYCLPLLPPVSTETYTECITQWQQRLCQFWGPLCIKPQPLYGTTPSGLHGILTSPSPSLQIPSASETRGWVLAWVLEVAFPPSMKDPQCFQSHQERKKPRKHGKAYSRSAASFTSPQPRQMLSCIKQATQMLDIPVCLEEGESNYHPTSTNHPKAPSTVNSLLPIVYWKLFIYS